MRGIAAANRYGSVYRVFKTETGKWTWKKYSVGNGAKLLDWGRESIWEWSAKRAADRDAKHDANAVVVVFNYPK